MARIKEPTSEDQSSFLKGLTRYYMDFLETDFHKRPLPKRHIKIRDSKGHLTGINLRKYETFHTLILDYFSSKNDNSCSFEIKRGQYKSRIKTSIKSFIDQKIDELEQDILDKVILHLLNDFKELQSKYHDNWDAFYEESTEALRKCVLQEVVQPLSTVLDKPLTEEKSLGLETIFELEDDLIEILCADIEENMSKPIIQFFSHSEEEHIQLYLEDFLKKEIFTEKLKRFFENFSSGDLFIELNQIFENKRLNDKEEIYLYFCDIKFNKRTYPLFYFQLQVEKQPNEFTMSFDPHVLVNKKAIEYIVQEYNKDANKTGGITSLKDRIIYLDSENQNISDHLQPILSDIASHFSFSEAIDLKNNKHKTQKSLFASVTNDAYFCLFDRADEALVNDYEELVHLIEDAENPLAETFINLVNGYIMDEPIPYKDDVNTEWDNKTTSDRLVYNSPIPLNEEQKKILGALSKNGCKYVTVQGPPGTGKSHTITAIAFDAIMNNRSVLILSDKKEALDVVEDKIVDTINKVRVSDDFQNPILRLDKRNYSRILAAPVIAKIEDYYKVAKQKEKEIEETLQSRKSTLKKSIDTTVKQYESIDLKEIKAFLDIEELLSSKIDLQEFNNITNKKLFPILQNFLHIIGKSFDCKYTTFFINNLSKEYSNWNSEGIEDEITFFNHAINIKESGDAQNLSIFISISEDTQNNLKSYIEKYKLLTVGFFGGFFKKKEITHLEIRLNSEFEFSQPITFSQDLDKLERALSDIAKIKQSLIQAGFEEGLFLEAYQILSNPSCPNKQFIDNIIPINEFISIEEDKFEPILTLLKTNLTFKELKNNNTVNQLHELVSLIGKYIKEEKKHKETFNKIPNLNYSIESSYIEELQTIKMANLIDKKVLNFVENNKSTAQTLKKIISKKQKFPRAEFQKLKEAFPCIIAGIRDYAEYIPLEKELFDIVIIDEASQVSIAQAFPAILRAKKVLVLGDSKQFSNVKTSHASKVINNRYIEEVKSSFAGSISNDLARIERVKHFDIKTSILEFFEFTSNYNIMLKKHFRGYRELISFSSKYFYEGDLQAIKIRGKSIDSVLKFTLLEHDGKLELPDKTNTNPFESEFIMKEIESLLEQNNPPTVGIITPFTNQQKFIANEVYKSKHTEEIYSKLKLKVMTFDTCQGEERDIIFYSMVASPISDRTNYVFASELKQDSDDENKIRLQRLNVGFSRSKECMHFVISKPVEDFTGSIGTALKHYETQLEKAGKQPSVEDVDPASPMEKKVIEWIKNTSFVQNNQEYIELHAQFPIGEYLKQLDKGYSHPNYRCDFLLQYVKDDITTNIIIEYDGFKEHFTNLEDVNELNYQHYYKASDVEREKVLESYGYNFLRINRFNTGSDPVETLSERLETLVKKKTITHLK